MDVQMPEMDGFEATRRLRAELGLTLPVIALTAGVLSSDRQKCDDAGMTGFIAKPFDAAQVIATIAEAIALPPVAEPVPPEPAEPAPTPPPRLPDSLPGIDRRGALLRLDGDEAMLASLLVRVGQQCGDLRAAVEADMAAEHWDEAGRRLHKFRGAAANVGAKAVAAGCSALEAACIDRKLDKVPELLATLSDALDELERTAATLQPPTGASETGATAMAATDLMPAAATLKVLVTANDLSAIDGYRSLRGALADHLAPQRLKELDAAVDGLDFPRAAAILDDVLRMLAPA
jgi:CheY-like chemotaxis protein